MKTRQSNDASKKGGKAFVPRRPTEFKPKSPDGIWLDRRGEDNNWELFRTQFIDMATREYGEVAQELGADEDLDEEIAEPNGDPNSFDYKIEMERLKLVLKKRETFEALRPKIFGNILCHLCLESERIVKDHADFAAANAHKSPRLLWEIIRITHVAPQHAGNMGMWFQRNKLYSMRQTSGQRIEVYARMFRQEYERLLALEGELPQDVAAQVFLISLEGETFSDKVAEWTRAGEVPDTLEGAITLAVEWFKTRTNARMAMGVSARRERPEAAFRAAHAHAASTEETCPICKRPATHSVDKCWELQAFAERARAAAGGGAAPLRKEKTPHKSTKSKVGFSDAKHGRGAKGAKGAYKKGQQAYSARDEDDDIEAAMSEAAWSARVDPCDFHAATVGRAETVARMYHDAESSHVIILDSGASISVWNENLPVENVRQRKPITLHGVDGAISSTMWGDHKLFGAGLIVAGMRISLVSLSEIQKRASVEYSQAHQSFKVTFPRSDPLYFDKNRMGLYQLRAEAAAMLGQRLELRDAGDYTKRQVDLARQARDLCKCFGHVGTEGLVRIIQSGTVINMPVSVQDVRRADLIFGPCVSCAVGKGTHRTENYTSHTQQEPRMPREPGDCVEHLHADFIYIPGPGKAKHVVLVSVGEENRLIVATKVDNRAKSTVTNAWAAHIAPYEANNIKVKIISTDNEATLGASKSYLAALGIQLKQHASEQHEPHVERRVRTIRERMRAVIADLDYTLPARLYYSLLEWVVQCINLTPDTLGAGGDVRCARERVTGQRVDAKALQTNFGEFVVYYTENHALTNLSRRNDIGIVIGRKPDAGVVRIWNPVTQRVCERRSFRRIAATDTLIATINDVASKEKAVDLDADVMRMTAGDTLNADTDGDGDEVPPDTQESNTNPAGDETVPEAATPADLADDPAVTDESEEPVVHEAEDESEEIADESEEPAVPESENENEGIADADQEEGGFHEPRYNLRRRDHVSYRELNRGRNAFTILTSSQAIQLYPRDGPAAIRAELENLLEYDTFVPASEEDLRHGRPIPSKLFIKVKTKPDGTFDRLKGRVVAGGHRQLWVDDSSSPTVAWETFLLGAATAAQFEQEACLTVLDVPSAYLNATAKSPVLMEVPAEVANILCELRPAWRRHKINGRLTVKVLKALYGLRDSGRLWYEHLAGTLQGIGLVPSAADPCLFMKEGDKSTMVMAYVDDLAIFARQTTTREKIVKVLTKEYGSLTVQRESPFSFVGTRIKVQRGSISIDCSGFIKKLAEQYGVTTASDTPSPSNYSIKGEGPPADVEAYRSLVMSLMYAAKRCRPDILANAALYATRINNPRTQDMQAAIKTLRYLFGTQDLGLRFGRNSYGLLLSADAAFNVHEDAKSHSGVAVFAGGAPVFYKSSKQKMVSKSSTEAELIACDTGVDMLMYIIALATQMGYKFTLPVSVLQDNKSAIFIFDRGRPTKKRAPINVKFQYILELIQKGTVKLEYAATGIIPTDILTKLLHGAAFKTAAHKILGNFSDR